MDWADQSVFGVLHFLASKKDDKSKVFKVRLVGLPEHTDPH